MSALTLRRDALRTAPIVYTAQRAYVATLFEVLGRLIIAASGADAVVQRELKGFPEGYVIGFSVLGDTLAMRVQRRGDRFVPAPSGQKGDLEIVFKHISHAFALLTFQESAAMAYAYDRMISHGDIGLSMRFMRCLDRVQGVMLPPPIAAMALKAVPNIPLGERLKTTVKTVGGLVRGLIPGSAA